MTSLRSFSNSRVPSSSDEEDLSTWAGAYVKVEATVNSADISVEGEVIKAKAALILLDRGKGKNQMLLERDEIRSMEEIPRPVPVTRITVRVLAMPDASQVRQHLADRHGVPLRGINPLPEMAAREHEMMHRLELGHTHDKTRGTTDDSRPSPDEIAERAAALDAEDREECDSCGRVVDGDREKFKEIASGESKGLLHCLNCADPDEFTYVS